MIIGGSLAGCATAILLARQGARVALVEKQPDPAAFKRICTHFIQASGIPTVERLGLLEPMLAAGAVRPRIRAWTRWGIVEPPPGRAGYGISTTRPKAWRLSMYAWAAAASASGYVRSTTTRRSPRATSSR